MKTLKFDEENGGREAWLNARLGKVTGSKLGDIYSVKGGRKTGSYRLVAESIIGSAALADDDASEENAMNRGTRLEPEAIARFSEETGKKVDTALYLWISDTDARIASSPDGVIGKTAAVEAKCLSSAKHVEALVTRKVPKTYEYQAVQYFIVNEKLKTLYFVFYDPRFPKGLDYLCLEITRKDMQEQIDLLLAYQLEELKWVRDTVNALTLYSPQDTAKMAEVHEELVEDHKAALDRVYQGIKARS